MTPRDTLNLADGLTFSRQPPRPFGIWPVGHCIAAPGGAIGASTKRTGAAHNLGSPRKQAARSPPRAKLELPVTMVPLAPKNGRPARASSARTLSRYASKAPTPTVRM